MRFARLLLSHVMAAGVLAWSQIICFRFPFQKVSSWSGLAFISLMDNSLLLEMFVILRCFLVSLSFLFSFPYICCVLSFSESELSERLGIFGFGDFVSGVFLVLRFLSFCSVDPGSFLFLVITCDLFCLFVLYD